ncbi:MAG: ribonuclease H family protein [Bacteroidetes bacterium]|nr:ribonuclease H family protein [Bacteroidota bacterium]MBU1717614.1 ribonuclease H family protein [Bacteroidota bacterium]
MTKVKFYVVWDGREPGIYDSWEKCKRQIEGFENAKYKSFSSIKEAEEAYNSNCWKYIGQKKTEILNIPKEVGLPTGESISVDAACSGNPGKMEYRGVFTRDGRVLFHQGPFDDATNNIGEFLAIVHALGYLKQRKLDIPIYTDSETAMKWVKTKKAKTKLPVSESNGKVFDLLQRAEAWLRENEIRTKIIKWETKYWGEIPADFGRK